MISNEIVNSKTKFSVALQSNKIKELINNTLQDPTRVRRFVTAITSAVATNPALQECDNNSIIIGALTGETLELSPSPILGNYYLIPFDNKKKGVKEAQFIMGWRGYYQLAIRSGQYKRINVVEIKEGELEGFNPLTEEIKVNIIEDDMLREQKETIGYYAYFEYLNGFKKAIYWSKEKVLQHADRYSKSFNIADYRKLKAGQIPKTELWKYSSPYYTMFDEMAKKTVLKQLISKYGILSIEMQEAIVKDQSVINEDNTYDYVDSPEEVFEKEVIEVEEKAQKAVKNKKTTKLDEVVE